MDACWKFLLSMLGMAALALSLSSCASVNSQLTADRPKDELFRTELKKEPSTVNIAIGASTGELSDMLNRMVAKELYKGSATTMGGSAEIRRNGPIMVGAADNYIYVTIPISISASYGIFETPPLRTKLRFKLNAKVTPEWKVYPELYYLGLSDSVAQEVGIGPISIKPRSIIEGITQPVERTLSGLIARNLNEKFPMKYPVAKVWDAAQKPILLDKKYNAWLKLTPQEVLLEPLYAQNNQVKLTVGLKSIAELVVGPEPATGAPVPLPNLRLVNGMDRAFRVTLNTNLFYKDMVSIARPLLLNKELGSDGKSVILKDLDIYGNGDRLIVKVATSGSLDGIFYLTCRPVFDPQTNMFSVQDVDFDMQSRSLLLKSANWFLHGPIRSAIQEKLNMDLTRQLVQARDMAGNAMKHVNLAQGVFLNGRINTIKLNDVMVQRDKISIQVYAEGETAIVLH